MADATFSPARAEAARVPAPLTPPTLDHLDALERAVAPYGAPFALPAEYVPAHTFDALDRALTRLEREVEADAGRLGEDTRGWARLAGFMDSLRKGVEDARPGPELSRLLGLTTFVIADATLQHVRAEGLAAAPFVAAWERWTESADRLFPRQHDLPVALCRQLEAAARGWSKQSAVNAVATLQLCRLVFERFPAAVGAQPTLAVWRNAWQDPDGTGIRLEDADAVMRLLLAWRRRLTPRWRALSADPGLRPEPWLGRTLDGLLGRTPRRVPVCRVMFAGPPGCGKTRLHAAIVRDSERFDMPAHVAWDPSAWETVDMRLGNVAPVTTSHGQLVLPAHREHPVVDLDVTDTAGEQSYLVRPADDWLDARSTTDLLVIVLSPEMLFGPHVEQRLSNLSLHARHVLKARPKASITLVFSKTDEVGVNPLFHGRLLDEQHAEPLRRVRRAAQSGGGRSVGAQILAALGLERRIPDPLQREAVSRLLERSAPLWADILVQPGMCAPWSFNAYLAAAESGLLDAAEPAYSVGACDVLADAIGRWRNPSWPFWFAGDAKEAS